MLSIENEFKKKIRNRNTPFHKKPELLWICNDSQTFLHCIFYWKLLKDTKRKHYCAWEHNSSRSYILLLTSIANHFWGWGQLHGLQRIFFFLIASKLCWIFIIKVVKNIDKTRHDLKNSWLIVPDMHLHVKRSIICLNFYLWNMFHENKCNMFTFKKQLLNFFSQR